MQNRDFSHFSNSSFHIVNEICGSVTSSRGENTQPPFLSDNSGGISVTHRYKKPGNFFSVLQKLLQRKQAPNRINNINKKHAYTSLEFSALKSRPHFLETRERGEKTCSCLKLYISSKVYERRRLCIYLQTFRNQK